MAGQQRVSWSEVQLVAQQIFTVWSSTSELGWARHAWLHLGRRGLTSYSNELGRAEVLVRLFALADFRRQFYYHLKRESPDWSPHYWFEEAEISDYLVGCLAAKSWGVDDLPEDASSAADSLVAHYRPSVGRVYISSVGGDGAAFVHLWRSMGGSNRRDSEDEILNEVSMEKMEAYAYLDSPD